MKDYNQYEGYVPGNYLDVAWVLLGDIKSLSLQRMRISSGHHVLDVGCGLGHDTISMALLVGEDGKVDGIDIDSEMVERANRSALANKVS